MDQDEFDTGVAVVLERGIDFVLAQDSIRFEFRIEELTQVHLVPTWLLRGCESKELLGSGPRRTLGALLKTKPDEREDEIAAGFFVKLLHY